MRQPLTPSEESSSGSNPDTERGDGRDWVITAFYFQQLPPGHVLRGLSAGQELWRGAGAEVQYLGSHAIHLDSDFYDNQPQPSTDRNINSRRPNQLFGTIRRIQNDEYSHYNGFTAILRQRASHGLSGMLSYTWSRDLDITDNSNGATTTMDQYDIGRDYGDSNWDIRHRFVGTATYELPNIPHANAFVRQALGSWQANAIETLGTRKSCGLPPLGLFAPL